MSSPEQEKTISELKTTSGNVPGSKDPFSPRISSTLEALGKQSDAVNQAVNQIVKNALSSYEKTLTAKLTGIANTSTVALEVALQEGIQSARSHQDATWRVLREHQNGIWNETKRITDSLTVIGNQLEEHAATVPSLIKQTWAPIVISAGIGLLIIALSWFMRPGMPSSMIEVKMRSGGTYLVVTDPQWEICTVEGRNRPCRRK